MARFYARRSQEDADDLLQEAWIGLIEALCEVDLSIGNPEQFLILRARWKMLDAIKRAHVRQHHLLDDVRHQIGVGDEPEDVTARLQDVNAWLHVDHLLASLAVADFTVRLKPTQQTVLRCLMHGFTWRETGSLLGCTSANIAYHVRQIARSYEEWSEEME